jgi:hypothetical protein
VYHGEPQVSTLREPGRGYVTVTQDLPRAMNRLWLNEQASTLPVSALNPSLPKVESYWMCSRLFRCRRLLLHSVRQVFLKSFELGFTHIEVKT